MVLIALGHLYWSVLLDQQHFRHFSFPFIFVISTNDFKFIQFNFGMSFVYGMFQNMKFGISPVMIFNTFY